MRCTDLVFPPAKETLLAVTLLALVVTLVTLAVLALRECEKWVKTNREARARADLSITLQPADHHSRPEHFSFINFPDVQDTF